MSVYVLTPVAKVDSFDIWSYSACAKPRCAATPTPV
jgi:hypothetical protein